jgi:uncharacterized membrane protein YkvA (DUF1232 family)
LTLSPAVRNVALVNPVRAKRNLPVLRKPGAIWRYLKNPNTAKLPKLFLLGAIAYVVMPVDLIPDIAPIVGWLDDLGFATFAIGWVSKKASEAAAAEEEERVSLLTEGHES